MDLYSDGRHYDALLGDQTADVEFYLSLGREAKGKVLEIACGTGRITIPLAKAGADIRGLDLSPSMLARAKEKADAESIDVEWIQADARTFDLGSTFSLIYYPYNSMEHLHDSHSLRAMFSRVRAHLEPDGIFALDVHQPSLPLLSRHPGEIYPVEELGQDPDGTMVTGEEVSYNDATQVYTIRWHYSSPNGEDPRIDELRLRMFFPQELDALLESNGFEILHKYGDFSRTPYSEESLKQVLVCRLNSCRE
jgi:SAM-dependent methyltransferase